MRGLCEFKYTASELSLALLCSLEGIPVKFNYSVFYIGLYMRKISPANINATQQDDSFK